MKLFNQKIYYLLLAIFTISITSCREETPPYEELTDAKNLERVYIVRKNVSSNLQIFPLQDTRTEKIGVAYGGLGLPASDIKVTLKVDMAALDSINNSRVLSGLTPYEAFPDDSYAFNKFEVTIPKGKDLSDYLELTYKPRVFEYEKDYALPISIEDASGYKITSSSKMILLTVPKVEFYQAIDRTSWSVTASSEEATGEGANTGRAIHAIDGDVNTFWHSAWYYTAPNYPHWLNFDMKKKEYVSKISITQRQNVPRGATKFYVEGSEDGTTWEALTDTLDLVPNEYSPQEFEISSPKEVRFVKITFTQGVSQFAYVAEVMVYTTPEELR